MKDCNVIRPLLSEYVDGTLEDNRAWEVKMHLATCSVCSRVADDFAATARLLSSLPAAQPSANFEAMLARRLADEVLKPKSPFAAWWTSGREWFGERWRTPYLGPAFASGAAVAVVVLATVSTFTGSPNGPRSPVPTTTPVAVTSPGVESDALNELWREHDAYASSVSLGDRASVLSSPDAGLPTL